MVNVYFVPTNCHILRMEEEAVADHASTVPRNSIRSVIFIRPEMHIVLVTANKLFMFVPQSISVYQ